MKRPACGKNLIYGLTDPRTGHLRYVGRSTSGSRRPFQHGQPYYLRSVRSHTSSWCQNLAAAGLRPGVVIIEDSPEDLFDAEQFWIAYFRLLGCDLTNHTEGGDGMVGFRHSETTKARIAATKKGRTATPEERERNRTAQLGRKHSPETIAKIRAAMAGRAPACAFVPKSPEHRARIAESNRRTKAEKRVALLETVKGGGDHFAQSR